MKRILFVLSAATMLSGCGYANLDNIKQEAPVVWEQAGFRIIGYEGFQWSFWLGGRYGGAHVWYTVRREPDNGIIYHGFIQRWGSEYHLYNIGAIDAIRSPK